MENCNADIESEEDCSYEEFTAQVNNAPGCASLEVLGGNLYRDNPTEYKHSCTPGVQESTAICVSSLNSCAYEPNSDYAVKMNVLLTPGISGTGHIRLFEFFEKAPEEFVWLNGASGPNNYPTKYGLRVLKDGVEIFRQDNNATSLEWSQEAFDFSNDPAFTTTVAAVYTFELLGYCLAGPIAPATAWDLDDIVIVSDCSNKLNAGDVYSSEGETSFEVCVGDGIPDVLPFYTNSTAQPYQWIITNTNNIITSILSSDTQDFESAAAGECRIWGATYNGNFLAELGDDIESVQLSSACWVLSSNFISVVKVDDGISCGGSLLNIGQDIEYTLYPNPAANYVQLEIISIPSIQLDVRIYNLLGDLVYDYQIEELEGTIIEVPIEVLANGNYTLKLSSNGKYQTKKFVKMK